MKSSGLTAREVADWLIAFHNDHGDTITNLRLQKLLYYAQAWHLAIFGQALFADSFEAWIHGPVIPSLYRRLQHHGSAHIPWTQTRTTDTGEVVVEYPPLPGKVAQHLKDLMGAYGHLSTWDLEALTHREKPWQAARGRTPTSEPSSAVISTDSMKKFYQKRLAG